MNLTQLKMEKKEKKTTRTNFNTNLKSKSVIFKSMLNSKQEQNKTNQTKRNVKKLNIQHTYYLPISTFIYLNLNKQYQTAQLKRITNRESYFIITYII